MDRALALLVFLCLAALPRIAGAGAWPREPGSGFVAVSYTGWGEVLGYIEGISTKTDPAAGDLTYELSIYAEYGLARRLTFGLDRFDRLGGASTETYLFLRRHLGARNARDQYAIEIAFGIEQTDLVPGSRQATRLGFFYGRGLDTRWGSGWLAIDAKSSWIGDGGNRFTKADVTLGLRPRDNRLTLLRFQAGQYGDAAAYLRVEPAYVWQRPGGVSLELGLTVGLVRDDRLGLKLGTWLEF